MPFRVCWKQTTPTSFTYTRIDDFIMWSRACTIVASLENVGLMSVSVHSQRGVFNCREMISVRSSPVLLKIIYYIYFFHLFFLIFSLFVYINIILLLKVWQGTDKPIISLNCMYGWGGVMLHIILLSSFWPSKIDVAFKITIGLKFKSDISKIQCNFKSHINFGETKKE